MSPLSQCALLFHCSIVPALPSRAILFSEHWSIGQWNSGPMRQCGLLIHCSIAHFPSSSPGVFISLESIALLLYCSRFSVPLISAVSILARISLYRKKEVGSLSLTNAPHCDRNFACHGVFRWLSAPDTHPPDSPQIGPSLAKYQSGLNPFAEERLWGGI